MDGERELRRGERRVAPGAQILVERGIAHVFDTPAFAAHEVVVSLSGQFVDRSGAVEAAACEYAGFEKHLHGVVYRGARYAFAVFLKNTTKPLDRKCPLRLSAADRIVNRSGVRRRCVRSKYSLSICEAPLFLWDSTFISTRDVVVDVGKFTNNFPFSDKKQ